MNTTTKGDFQICFNLPLNSFDYRNKNINKFHKYQTILFYLIVICTFMSENNRELLWTGNLVFTINSFSKLNIELCLIPILLSHLIVSKKNIQKTLCFIHGRQCYLYQRQCGFHAHHCLKEIR